MILSEHGWTLQEPMTSNDTGADRRMKSKWGVIFIESRTSRFFESLSIHQVDGLMPMVGRNSFCDRRDLIFHKNYQLHLFQNRHHQTNKTASVFFYDHQGIPLHLKALGPIRGTAHSPQTNDLQENDLHASKSSGVAAICEYSLSAIVTASRRQALLSKEVTETQKCEIKEINSRNSRCSSIETQGDPLCQHHIVSCQRALLFSSEF
ncbi:hypothetical protein JTE90_012027 [Oedothorax gibbosus]|uniref:Uncharacterized protein n=1 Tax=Oedothorax gibbosus TaxID=931172 RepID=A0AAV6UD75_9ARAC|nr:hypothetical protein JTE90_012027 [Oedothorax gibbosus]